ncbi:MAG: STAS domain-containing protein [Clostridia bacterium]|nr:STAS domain-containing protein [Clostridia bacterium]
MIVTKKMENAVLTVYLDGKMDTNTTPIVEKEIEADVEEAKAVVIDMKDLKYISSAGLRLLLSLHKKMAAKSGMTIKNANETITEIFEFTGFADVFTIE